MANEKIISQSVFEQSIKDILTELVNSTYDWQEYTDTEISDILEISDAQAMELEKIINDGLKANNKLWSSEKTSAEIQNSIIEANKYADDLVANLSNIKLDIVDALPDSSTVNKSTIYILKDSTGGTNNTLNVWSDASSAFVEVGKLSVDFTNYYTKSEVDTELAKKANADEVLKPDAIVADLTTTSGSTTLSTAGLQTELDKKANDDEVVKAADIATTIDSTSTDTKVPSAKAVYDSAIKYRNKDYYFNSNGNNLGISDVSEITSLLYLTQKMKEQSTLLFQVNNDSRETLYNNGVIPVNVPGLMTIEILEARSKALYSTDNGRIFYTGTSNGKNTNFNRWKQLNPGSLIYANNDQSVIDFNSYKDSGTYFIEYNTKHLNAPTAYNGWLQVFGTRTDEGALGTYIKQIFYRFGTGDKSSQESYERLYNGASWSKWTRITDISNLKLLNAEYVIKGLGLTADGDGKYALSDIFNALPDYSITIIDNNIVSTTDIPDGGMGTFQISKISNYRNIVQYFSKTSEPSTYSMGIADSGGLSGNWVQYCTTKSMRVRNKQITKITSFSDETNYKPYDHTRYYISGGMCFVNVDISVISPNTNKTTVLTGLPKPVANDYVTIPAFGVAGKIPLTVSYNNGNLDLFYGEAGCRYLGSFSYAVAD